MSWWRKSKPLKVPEFLAETMKLLEVDFQSLVFPSFYANEYAVVYMVKEDVRRVVLYYPKSGMSFLSPIDLMRTQRQFTELQKENPGVTFQFVLLTGATIFPFYHDVAFMASPSFSIAGSMLKPVDAFYHLRNVPVPH